MKNQRKNFVDFQNYQKSNIVRSKFKKIQSYKNLPWGHVRSHKKLGPIGSVVLTFIGYKQTKNRQEDKQTDKESKYINIE